MVLTNLLSLAGVGIAKALNKQTHLENLMTATCGDKIYVYNYQNFYKSITFVVIFYILQGKFM